LSTRSKPSAWSGPAALLAFFGGIVRPGLAGVDLGEKGFDSRCALNRFVHLEDKVRCDTQPDRTRDTVTEVRSDALQAFVCLLFFFVSSEHAHENAGVPEVRRNFDAGDSDEADDARVLGRFSKKCCYFFPNGFSDPVGAPVIAQRPSA
jgi:hypothetical protein